MKKDLAALEFLRELNYACETLKRLIEKETEK